MATYKEIQAYVKTKHGFIPKTCWIAHVKELCGLIDENPYRMYPCPQEKISAIKEAFRYFGMVETTNDKEFLKWFIEKIELTKDDKQRDC